MAEIVDTQTWVPLVDCETFVEKTLREGIATTWADNHGVWHVAVRRTCVAPLLAARRALRDELVARDSNVARDVWLHPVIVDRIGDCVVYREGDVPVVENDELETLPETFWDKDGDRWTRVDDCTDFYTSPCLDGGREAKTLDSIRDVWGPITVVEEG